MQSGKQSAKNTPLKGYGTRKRCSNFTNKEELELLNLVKPFLKIINNKESNAGTWKDKEKAWNDIAAAFYRNTGVERTKIALRAKYESLKKKGRNKVEVKNIRTVPKREPNITIQTVTEPQAGGGAGDSISNNDREMPGVLVVPFTNRQSQQPQQPQQSPDQSNEIHQKKLELLEMANQRAEQKHQKEMEILEANGRLAQQILEKDELQAYRRHEWEEARHTEEMERLEKEEALVDLKILNYHMRNIPTVYRTMGCEPMYPTFYR